MDVEVRKESSTPLLLCPLRICEIDARLRVSPGGETHSGDCGRVGKNMGSEMGVVLFPFQS